MKFGTLMSAAAMTIFVALGLAANARPQTFTTLYSFRGKYGETPEAGLVQATRDGQLYGTTAGGGTNRSGMIFAISPSGQLTELYDFCSQAGCTDGATPEKSLVQDSNGYLYGTTFAGGASSSCDDGCGTVFKITPGGTLTTLYSFCSQTGCADGAIPQASLIQAADGTLYGTTSWGGASNYGTIFEISPSGTLTTLHSFDGTDGKYPWAALVQATDGNFYGTTTQGGNTTSCDGYGCGTVFKITPTGTLTTLNSFDGTDGDLALAPLIQATDGNFYGTTLYGGANYLGNVFEMTADGTLTTLYSFCSQNYCVDGVLPTAPLVQATDGNFYGTASQGGNLVCSGAGSYGCGLVFKITPSGKMTTIHLFDETDGKWPYAPLVQDTNGSFYGTTSTAGPNGAGTVFSLSVGLGPFVETLPTAAKVGASVQILGTNLTGATSVTFNGTAATFVIGSPNGIVATVPAGATSGSVQVVTPGGTLSSNVPFHVSQ